MRSHTEIIMEAEENRLLADPHNGLELFVQDLKSMQLAASHRLVGIKHPMVWRPRILGYYRKYFYKTKIVLGVRHPVWWFQRYARTRQFWGYS